MNGKILRDRAKQKPKTNLCSNITSHNYEVSNLPVRSKQAKEDNNSVFNSKLFSSTGLEETDYNSSASVNCAIEGEHCKNSGKIKKTRHLLKHRMRSEQSKSDQVANSNKEETALTSRALQVKDISVRNLSHVRKTKNIAKQTPNMGIPEIIIADDVPPENTQKLTNSKPQSIENKQDVVFLSSKKRKSLNDSIVILQEVKHDNNSCPPAKKRRVKEPNCNDKHNESVISLCDDEISIIGDVCPKKNTTPAADIILLDSSSEVNDVPKTNVPVAKGTKRNGTCTVTRSNKNPPPSYDSLLTVFRQDNESISNNTVSSTSSLFTFDKGGRFPLKRRKNRHDKWRSNQQSVQNKPTSSESDYRQVNKPLAPAADGSNPYGNNIYNPNPQAAQSSGGLRPIIIDGSNVAVGHSNGKRLFSCRGLQICINYFATRGHNVKAFVPQYRKSDPHVTDRQILEDLEKSGYLVFTPSRRVEGKLLVPYDDRYIVQCAAELGGVIVSTDNYRDLLAENEAWKDTIQNSYWCLKNY